MIVQAEILSIGDELCYGLVYDTNSFWLADQVTRLGVVVERITCVRDNVDAIYAVLKEMLNRKPYFIFITGGLGPTADDKTLEALSKLTGQRVVVDETALKIAAERRKVSALQLSSHHFKMTATLEGAECLPNPVGWAPLTIVRLGETILFALPGPPKETQGCFTSYLMKKIENETNYHSIAKRVFVTMFEAEVAPLINIIYKAISGIYIKPLVGEAIPNVGLPVEIIVFNNNEKTCQKKYRETVNMLTDLVRQKGKDLKEVET